MSLFFSYGDKMKGIIKEYGIYVLLIIAIILIKTYAVTIVRVNGTSMDPTLKNKDFMILNKIDYKINDIDRFDIIVIKSEDKQIIKRVIALPNEKIEYKDNKLYINGEEYNDPYNSIDQKDFKVTLKEDEYYVMGDNRVYSRDSRIIGPIKKEQIKGKANFVIFPFSRWGSK